MNVSAGFYHPTLGFKFLELIDVTHASEWLLTIDCDLLGSDVFDWDGALIPVDELCPTIVHLHGLDKAFNRMFGLYGRGYDYAAKMP